MASVTSAGAGPDFRHVARGGRLNLVGVAIATVANIALTICITRLADPAVAGTFFTGTSALLVLSTLCRLGSNTGLVYFTARARARATGLDLPALIATARTPVVTLTLAVALILVAAPALGAGGGWSAGGIGIGLVLAVALLPMVMHEVWLSVTRGLRRMGPTVAIERVGIPLGQLLAVAAAAAAGLGNAALLAAWTLPYLAGAVAARLVLDTAVAAFPRPAAAPAATVTSRAFWRFTVPRAVSSLAQMGMARLDIVLVAWLRGPTEAAIYVVATRFVVVGQLASQALALSVQPHVAAAAAAGDRPALRAMYRLTTSWLVLMTWPVYLVCAALAPEMLSLFGTGYSDGLDVVYVMVVATLVATASGMVDVFLNMAGRSSWTMLTAVAGLSTMILVDVVLVGPLGATGAAIGWASAMLVRNGLSLAVLHWQDGLTALGGASLLAVVISAVSFGPSVLATVLDAPTPWRVLALAAGVVGWVLAVGVARRRLGVDLLLGRAGRPSEGPAPTQAT